ncbi:GRIN2B [Lepeophtheirus salmonis]|uniref:GRIN2B n=1 Tax=Lepeophtheirus salmonis TaxID=72036 RepID=A0A7R8CAM9_LEPSM|nr:GRIN2B [Lepeophtheirus salmonis]CAF2752750.1 GRIN2B [Lepeophtheirus salmonis]
MNIGHEKLSSFGKQRVFNVDGSLRQTEMKIMNFKPRTQNSGLAWEEVGTWNSWNGLDIKDIVWPGGSHLPPQGVPEKFYMKITFLEEPPFIILSDPDPISSKCSMNRGVPCYMSEKHLRSHANSSQESTKCCSGLCIDLLRKFEDEMGFTYDLIRVEDPKWGTIEIHNRYFHRQKIYTWTGPFYQKKYANERLQITLWDTGGMERIGSITSSYYKFSKAAILVYALDCPDTFHLLSQHLLDIVMNAENAMIFLCGNKFDLKSKIRVSDHDMAIFHQQCHNLVSAWKMEWTHGNFKREAAVDFTIPFLESGIAIVVAKRTGIISPTAFLEPFDTYSWMLVSMVAIQASAFSIFFFEWLSPSGYNMQVVPSKSNHRFSLVRTYWLVWAVLFQASVQVDCPRGLTARFMSTAFMIPRKEYHDLSGLDDRRISNPLSQKPALKFGTLPYSYSQVTLQKHYSSMFSYMRPFNRYNNTEEAIRAVKTGKLDAFIYDGTVLNYLVSQDEECRLLQVGSWSGMTGYALAFPQHSKFKAMFDQKILELRENGDLERLSRYWMSGSFLVLENLQQLKKKNNLSASKIGSRESSNVLDDESRELNGPTTIMTSLTRNSEGVESCLSKGCGDNYCNIKLFHLENELIIARERIVEMEEQLQICGGILKSKRLAFNDRMYIVHHT